MIKTVLKKQPVLILGGIENALSITRSLGKRGIEVYVSVLKNTNVLYSKYCKQCYSYSDSMTVQDFWSELLLSETSRIPDQTVIFPCNDNAIEFVARNRDQLAKKYVLDDFIPEIHLAMLDKKKTLQYAKAANIEAPNFFEIETLEDLRRIESAIVFPVIIKPIYSHIFQKQFKFKKYFFANDSKELYHYLKIVFNYNIKVMIVEFIPGSDDLLGSYYTYIDSNDNPLFHYTKKIIRRFPKNEGLACCHKTEWDDEIAAIGYKFFKGIHYRGLGNVEFKRDLRDGRLKIIECNPRFTAAQELITTSGLDISLILYNHLVGLPLPEINSYKQNLRLWFPVRDFFAYRELRSKNEITFGEWLKSVLYKPVFPYFKWSDPLPSMKIYINAVKPYLKRRSLQNITIAPNPPD